MALQELLLGRKLKNFRGELEPKIQLREELKGKMAKFEEAIKEVEDGDMETLQVIEEEMKPVETEIEENESGIKDLESKIKELEDELKELEEVEEVEEEVEEVDNNIEKRSRDNMKGGIRDMNNVRERVLVPEVREFYESIRDVVINKRGLTGGNLAVPTQVISAILPQIGKFSKYYDKVDVLRLNGNARVVVPGATPTGVWLECCDPLEELNLKLTAIDLDCFKVGGYVPVCNAMLEDSFVDLALYVERELAKSIGKAIDVAFITGKAASKSMTGLIESKLPKVSSSFKLAELMAVLAEAEEMEDFADHVQSSERYLIMNTKDYFKNIAGQLLIPQVDGKYLIEAFNKHVLPDGTKVITDKNVPAGKAFYGDLKGYKLGERKQITIEESKHVQFIQDNTVFKGVGRYDGKVASPTIVEVTLPEQGE